MRDKIATMRTLLRRSTEMLFEVTESDEYDAIFLILERVHGVWPCTTFHSDTSHFYHMRVARKAARQGEGQEHPGHTRALAATEAARLFGAWALPCQRTSMATRQPPTDGPRLGAPDSGEPQCSCPTAGSATHSMPT